jgi:hypothetical protein
MESRGWSFGDYFALHTAPSGDDNFVSRAHGLTQELLGQAERSHYGVSSNPKPEPIEHGGE